MPCKSISYAVERTSARPVDIEKRRKRQRNTKTSVHATWATNSERMFSVKLKVKEDPRAHSLPRRPRRSGTPSSSFSSSTSSLSRLQNGGNKQPTKSSFLSQRNGKNNKKVRIQTSYEQSQNNYNGRWTNRPAMMQLVSSSPIFTRSLAVERALNWIWHTYGGTHIFEGD